MNLRFNISRKLIFAIILLVFILTIITGFYSFNYQKKTLLSEFDTRAKVLIESLVVSSEYPVLTGNDKVLNSIGSSILKQKDVAFCEITNNNNEVLFQQGSKGARDTREYIVPILTEQSPKTPDEMVFLDSQEKKFEEIGKVKLVFSLASLTSQLEQQKKIMLFLVLIGVMLTSSIITFMIRVILGKPINELIKGTEEISAGDLNYRVPVKTSDEIGMLAVSFNKMTKDLQKSTTSVDNLNKEIAMRKKVEEDLKASKETLQQQKKTLEDVNKELDDFTYIVSHDLKEPLRSIDAYSKFIAEDFHDKLSEDGRHYLERIRSNTERMKKLIEDLLEISRLKRKGSTIEGVEVEELINEVKMRLEYLIKEKAAEIIVKDKLPKIFCDRIRLGEVFLNLISNAIKFNDKPKPIIEIGWNNRGDFHEFYLKDNGIGIKNEYFDKIFEIFQRLGKREEAEGTGAGLTIVKAIVQMHKGKIWLESKLGEGTTFYFTIPKDKSIILGKKLIGEILVEKKLITEENIRKALEEQEKTNRTGEGGQNGRVA